MDKVEIERTILDGRVAERHTSFNEDGDKIVEIFAEDKRPLHLEKRIVQKHKNIVAEERTEYVKNGEIVEVEVKALDSGAPLQVQEHLGIADHASVMDGQYATKHDVKDAVIAGIHELVDSMDFEPAPVQAMAVPMHQPAPIMSAAEQIGQRVETKKSSDNAVNMLMIGLILAQLAFGFYVFFM